MKTHYTLNGTGELLLPQNQLPAKNKIQTPESKRLSNFLTYLTCVVCTAVYSCVTGVHQQKTPQAYEQPAPKATDITEAFEDLRGSVRLLIHKGAE